MVGTPQKTHLQCTLYYKVKQARDQDSERPEAPRGQSLRFAPTMMNPIVIIGTWINKMRVARNG
jgi:hypothetical protein